MLRRDYTMTQADFDEILDAINAARAAPLIMMQCGSPLRSPQEAANDAWCKLGDKMGFEGMTVEPGNSKLEFSAVPKELI